jgi:hypothetical protein
MYLLNLLSRCVSFSTGNKMPLPRHCWHVLWKYPIEKPSYQMKALVQAIAAHPVARPAPMITDLFLLEP